MKLIINGRYMEPVVRPYWEGPHLLVPLTQVASRLGGQIEGDAAETILGAPGRRCILRVGETKAHLSQGELDLGTPVCRRENTTLVPLDFLARFLGAGLFWDGACDTWIIGQIEKHLLGQRILLEPLGGEKWNWEVLWRLLVLINLGGGLGVLPGSRGDTPHLAIEFRAEQRTYTYFPTLVTSHGSTWPALYWAHHIHQELLIALGVCDGGLGPCTETAYPTIKLELTLNSQGQLAPPHCQQAAAAIYRGILGGLPTKELSSK
ncbi:MAG: copper amine oxidase N-terminal domain-containing protein [Limnochordia bacterium]|jgi:hypothetical protein